MLLFPPFLAISAAAKAGRPSFWAGAKPEMSFLAGQHIHEKRLSSATIDFYVASSDEGLAQLQEV